MKKYFLSSLITFSAIVNLFAQTPVPGGNVYGTWTLAGSPYQVQGSIQIPNDSTLIIQPGVTVEFQGTYKLNVLGRLLAIGTVTDSITFIPADSTNGWRGIRFDNTPAANDTSKIIYCKLQYGKATGSTPNDNGGALYFNNFSKTIISKCRISNCEAINSGGGIYCEGGNPTISNNTFTNNTADNGGGINCNGCTSNISNNNISNNSATSSLVLGGGGVFCRNGNPNLESNTISNNTANKGSGIMCYTGNPTINNNIIINNTSTNAGGGICCSGGDPVISNNIICNNSAGSGGNGGGGIFCNSGSNPIIINTIISNNTSTDGGGIYCAGGSASIYNTTISNNRGINGGALYCNNSSIPTLQNTILWGNTVSTAGPQVFLFDETSDPNFYYCDVQGGSAAIDANGNFYTGTYQNNINTDPLFVSPSGGSGMGFNGLTADWSLQVTSPCIDTGDPATVSPTTDIAGNPRVTVCRVDMGAYEYQNGTPFLLSISETTPILCNGASTGVLTAVASGGTLPYTYLWGTGATTSTINNIPAGTYSVSVGNASGCTRSATITTTQPSAMSLPTSQTNINCNGNCIGSASVSVSGGTSPYTYAWSTSPVETTAATSATLCTGDYSVTVTDSQGCTNTATVTITTPGALSFTTSQTNVSCNGGNNGSITINATGGSGTLEYSNDGGIGFQLSNIFNGLTAGTYSIAVKDGNGCQTSVTLITVTEPAVLSTSVTPSTINCYGAADGTALANVTGGTTPYTYSWNSVPVQTTATATGLSLGNYTVSVTDNKGCASSASTTIVSSLPTVPVCLVTVDTATNTQNLIIWEKPVSNGIDSFRIYREIGLNNYVLIGEVHYDSLSWFTDTTNGVNPKVTSYRYKISAVDSCGSESAKSPHHRTIHLSTPQFTPPNTFDLIWTNDYEGFFFSQYYILRDGNNNGNWIKIDSVTFGNLSYTDIAAPSDSARYIVEAAPAQPCSVSIKSPGIFGSSVQSSKSNTSDKLTATSVAQPSFNNSIDIYPNPSSGLFFVKSENNISKIIITNMIGVKIYSSEINAKKYEIDISRQPNGIYFIQTTTEKGAFVKKIIISK